MYEEDWDDPSGCRLVSRVFCSSIDENPQKFERSGKSRSDKAYHFKKLSNDRSWRNNNEFSKRSSNYNSNEKERYNSVNDLYMRVEGSKIGLIIGRQGSKIKELSEKSGAKIKIGKPCQDDSYLTEIIIIGNEESKKKCQEMIHEIVEKTQRIKVSDLLNSQNCEKTVPVIDWDALNESSAIAEAQRWEKCPPIKKDFYFEDSKISNMDDDEVDSFRKKLNIIVSSTAEKEEKIPNPIQTFAQAFQNYPEIMREIEKKNFKVPSPIQCQAWPILLSGRDLIGIAQTGTGKTLAFLLPALIHIDGQDVPRSQRGGANVLIIAPTRELALQIESEVKKYSYRNIRCVCVYGGGNRMEQINGVTEGIEIIIATPGRLNDLVESSVIDVSSITYIVLDEADRMLDMGFEPQIRKVLLDIRPDRQSVMTSATWPANVQNLAKRYMSNPIQVHIGSLNIRAVHSVAQTVLVMDEDEKKTYLLDVLGNLTEEDKIIIFVGKKRVADDLSSDLTLDYIKCQCIHGGREQIDREEALEDLRTGMVKILIATDVASRGLDICDITKVVNYDFPKNIEEYVHRVGRTGRAGKTGEAITFFTRNDWANAGDLIAVMEEANQGVPKELYDMQDRFIKKQFKKNEERSSEQKLGNFRKSRYDGDFSINY